MNKSKVNGRKLNLDFHEILKTPTDGCYDDLALLAVKIFDVPIAIIALVDSDRMWLKSSVGLKDEHLKSSTELCYSAYLSDDVYIKDKTRVDPRMLSNPVVSGAMGLQFFAAAPLRSSHGPTVGSFCIMDERSRNFTVAESSMLRQLARVVMDYFDLKVNARLLVKDIQKNLGQTYNCS
ncbi:GAF domain-containing protein [Arenibacter sp. BSSL-BM3]|uniref:GAF domain-containing protein n=1 Tax=Arenibacter arenosicollis TaxID=2762274 RepID=A0ABR7QS89_9FLAO|nr:GAF domain-containing protein [Arenibacter arenosicollis]MBC8769845.1 GAF domain-containing protein [Arenibacter arenosicollis]